MSLLYRLAADLIVVIHAGYVLYVLVGQVLILLGILRKWSWICNPWFRWTHLAAIAIVVAESWCGVTCPLTTLEQSLRVRAGQAGYRGDFLANLVHDLLFYELPPAFFTAAYSLFCLLVLATFAIAPPRRTGRV